MRTALTGLVLVVCMFLAGQGFAEEAKPLTNQDVVQMVKAGLPESTILLSIKSSPADFKTAPTDLIALKKAGVSQPILDSMLTKGSTAAGAAAAANAASAPAMPDGVVAIDGSRRVELMMTVSPRFRTKVRPGMLMLGQKQIRMDILPGDKSAIRLTSGPPSFEVPLPSNVNPGQLVKLVRLEMNGGDREVAAGLLTFGPTTQKEIPQDVVPTTLEPIGAASTGYSRAYRMTPTAALAPGEYVVIFNGQYWDFGVD